MTLVCQSCEGAKGEYKEREFETANHAPQIANVWAPCDECGEHEFPGEQPCQHHGCTKSATTDSYYLVCDDHVEDAEAERAAQKAWEQEQDYREHYNRR